MIRARAAGAGAPDALQAPGVRLTADHLIGLRSVALMSREAPPLSSLPGAFRTRKRGQGQEIADVREYVVGDDLRHLDRGSTARTGTFHVRTFEEERDRATLLVADFRPPMLWGLSRAFLSVAAAEALALIGWRAVEDGGRVGLVALGAGEPEIVPVRGRVRAMLAVIGGMVRAHEAALRAAAGGAGTPPLARDAARLARVAPRGGEVVIASNFEEGGEGLEAALGDLGQRRTVRLIEVSDGMTGRLPAGVYPIRRPDGARLRVRVTGPTGREEDRRPAGLKALRIEAAAPVAETARRLAAAPAGRGAP